MPDTHGNSVVDNMAATVGGSKTAKLVAGIDMTNRLQSPDLIISRTKSRKINWSKCPWSVETIKKIM